MKKILLSIMLGTVIILAACSEPPLNEDTPTYEPEDASTFITVDINPSITFTLDEDEVITSYVLSDEDAEIIAADLDFVGLTYDEALDLYLNAAIETGYVDVTRTDNVVVVTTTNKAEEEYADFQARVQDRVAFHLSESGVQASIEDGAQYYDEIREQAEANDISVGRVILIRAAMRNDETLTFEEALKIEPDTLRTTLQEDFKDRIEAYNASRENEAASFKAEIRDLVQARIAEYREAIENGEEVPPESRRDLKDDLIDEFRRFKEELEAERESNPSE